MVTREVYIKTHGESALTAIEYLPIALERAGAPPLGYTESTSVIIKEMSVVIATRLLRAMRTHPNRIMIEFRKREKKRNEVHKSWKHLSGYVDEEREKKLPRNTGDIARLENLAAAMTESYSVLFYRPPKPQGKHDGLVLKPELVVAGDRIFHILDSAWKEAGVTKPVSAATRYKVVHACLSLSMGVSEIATVAAVKQAIIRYQKR